MFNGPTGPQKNTIMTTYFVTIDSVISEFTNVNDAYKAISNAIYENTDVVASLAVSDRRGEVWDSNSYTGADLETFYLEELAIDHDLEVIDSVEGNGNGYPAGFEKVLTGFESWEQAKELADNNELCLVWLHRRDGWQCWERYNFASDPIEVAAAPEDLGYACASTESAKDFMVSELKDASWQDCDSYEDIEERLDYLRSIAELLEDREDDQVVLYNTDNSGEEPTLCKKYIISYAHDTHEYKLAVMTL